MQAHQQGVDIQTALKAQIANAADPGSESEGSDSDESNPGSPASEESDFGSYDVSHPNGGEDDGHGAGEG